MPAMYVAEWRLVDYIDLRLPLVFNLLTLEGRKIKSTWVDFELKTLLQTKYRPVFNQAC